jgi:hypothetical protein
VSEAPDSEAPRTISWSKIRERIELTTNVYDVTVKPRPQEAVALLYLEALAVRRTFQDVPECTHPDESVAVPGSILRMRPTYGMCCPAHLAQRAAHRYLTQRGKEVGYVLTTGGALSEQWWQDHGYELPSKFYVVD